jgi:hypothetical protein
LALKLVAGQRDLPRGWQPVGAAPDTAQCDLTGSSPVLTLGRGARQQGQQFRFGTSDLYLSTTGYAFAKADDATAFVKLFTSAAYLRCLKRVNVAAIKDPPVGAAYRDFRTPANDKLLSRSGYVAYQYLKLQQIIDSKYVDGHGLVYYDLFRYRRLVYLTTVRATTAAAETSAALAKASVGANAANAAIYNRIPPALRAAR